jgi:NitT/TauT family transport system permease protein
MTDPRRGREDGRRLEFLSLPLLLLLWQVAAAVVAHRLFPGPVAVAAELWRLASGGHLLEDLGRTLFRALSGFVLAMVIGSVVGAALGRWSRLDRLFAPWVMVGLNIPAIVVAIACYIWMGLTEFALITAVTINKAPLVMTALREGVRSLSPELAELAAVYRMPFWRRFLKVTLPQLMPFWLTAARTGLSLIWKIVLVFEVLGSDGGVGFRVGLYFQLFDIAAILAYTVAFIAVVLAFEYGVMRPMEQRVLGWRPARS